MKPQWNACDRCTQGVMDAYNIHANGRCECDCHYPAVRGREQSALVRALALAERREPTAACFAYAEGRGECGETPCFRVATPHGHFDSCGDHVDGLIVSLPSEWLDGWRESDPLTIGSESDDIPF